MQLLAFPADQVAGQEQDVGALVETALNTLEGKMLEGWHIMVKWSGGKDSTVLANLVLAAARRLKEKGGAVPSILITSSDTGVDNPAMSLSRQAEAQKMRDYAAKHEVPVQVEIVRPELIDQWAVQHIGRGALPIFPNATQRRCSVQMKKLPQQRFCKKYIKSLGVGAKVLHVTGIRKSESATRARKMAERQDDAVVPVQDKDGSWMLSPICEWTTDSVWEYLGYAQRGDYDACSDFGSVFDLYAAASEGCLLNGGGGSACGARDGCFLCVAIAEDKSLKRMIETNPKKYGYLSGLNRLRDFISATQYDWDRRQWMSRDVDRYGYMEVAPSAYNPDMLAEILRYALTLDAEESAAQYPEAPRFQIVSAQALIAIDWYWSIYGYHQPFEALRIYRDVYINGARYYPPEIERFAQTPMPASRFAFVGREFAERYYDYAGLCDPWFLLQSESCGLAVKWIGNRPTYDIEGERLSVDEESAHLLLELELDDLLSKYEGQSVSPILGAIFYHGIGAVTIARGGLLGKDLMMRRTAHRWGTGTLLFGRQEVERLDLLVQHPNPASASQKQAKQIGERQDVLPFAA